MATNLIDLKNFEELAYQLAINPSFYSGKAFSVNKFGYNPDIDSTKADIWSVGGTKTNRVPADTGIVEVLSSDGNDAANGTGARAVVVLGYDADGNFVSDWQELNGTTPVELDTTMMDVYRAYITSSGSSEYNEGTITIRHKTGSVALAGIPIGFNQTQMSQFTIPNGYTGFFLGGAAIIGGLQGAGGDRLGDVHLEVKTFGEPWKMTETFGGTSGSGSILLDLKFPLRFSARTSIKASCTAETANTRAYTAYDLICINNSFIA